MIFERLNRMKKRQTRKQTKKQTRKHKNRMNGMNGGGYTTPLAYYQQPGFPTLMNPFVSIPSTNATSTMIRPVLTQSGGSKKLKGGFSPSVMGSFIPNAQAAIVPLALYAVYHTMVPKKTRKQK